MDLAQLCILCSNCGDIRSSPDWRSKQQAGLANSRTDQPLDYTCLDQERDGNEYAEYKHSAKSVQMQRPATSPIH